MQRRYCRESHTKSHTHPRWASTREGVEECATEINGGGIVRGTPKSHERRSVPIPRSIVDELAPALANKDRDDLAFSLPTGGVLRNRNARAIWFDKTADAIGQPG